MPEGTARIEPLAARYWVFDCKGTTIGRREIVPPEIIAEFKLAPANVVFHYMERAR